MRSIYVQVVQHSPEHRLLARFLPRPPGATRFRSFDKVGRPWLLRTTLMLLLGLLLPLPLILLFLLRLLLPRRQFVCGWSCALISLVISCVHSHARGEITASGNFTYMQTLVASERFLRPGGSSVRVYFQCTRARPSFWPCPRPCNLGVEKTACSQKVLSQQPRHGSARPPHNQVQREWELRVPPSS